MRATKGLLDEIKKQYCVDTLYSWSRISTFMTSKYEYFLKYILHESEDVSDCAYAPLGSMCHDILEKYYRNKIKYEDMVNKFDTGWLSTIDIAQLKFDRNDEEANKKIADKYKYNLQHFYRNHIPIKHDKVLEEFIIINVDGNIFYGYIDILFCDKDLDIYTIGDWKTSTAYSTSTAEEKCGQLVLYALGMHQKGVPLEKIRICWNFLKYCNVLCEKPHYVSLTFDNVKGEVKTKDKIDFNKVTTTVKTTVKAWLKYYGYSKNDIDNYIELMDSTNSIECLPLDVLEHIHIEDIDVEEKPRKIERCKLGETLQANVKKQMKLLGYDDKDIEYYQKYLLDTNTIECLPKDVQEKYVISDCYVYVPLTEELVEKWITIIKNTLIDIKYRELEYARTKNPKLFWDSLEEVKAQSYYYATLCGYSANLLLPYKEYLEKLEEEKAENENLFVTSTKTFHSAIPKSEDMEYNNVIETENSISRELDLSWLDNI